MTDIQHCARCDKNHKSLQFKKLERPFVADKGNQWNDGIEYTHWAPCPTNGEPIMMAIYDTGLLDTLVTGTK